MVDSFVHDAFITRRLARLVQAAGWRVARTTSHGLVETAGAEYMLTLVERGEFFGFIAYLSVIARLA
jgi:hypothetical protein